MEMSNGQSLTVNFTGMCLGLTMMFFFGQDCHASASFDNVNPFSDGFLLAGHVQYVYDTHHKVARGWNGEGAQERCWANARIRRAYSLLPYRVDLAQLYAAEADKWCEGNPPL